MITQDAYDLLKEEQQEGESYSQAIIRILIELQDLRQQVSPEPHPVEQIGKEDQKMSTIDGPDNDLYPDDKTSVD